MDKRRKCYINTFQMVSKSKFQNMVAAYGCPKNTSYSLPKISKS
jgi:hypothetical protein